MLDALGHIAFGLFGLAVLIFIAFLFSNNKRAVSWKLVASGVGLQLAFATVVLKVPFGSDVFNAIALGFVIATAVIAVLVNSVEKERASIPQPAE